LYDLETQQFFVSLDVVFYENQFPFVSPTTKATSMKRMSNDGDNAYWLDEIEARGVLGKQWAKILNACPLWSGLAKAIIKKAH